MPIKKGHSTDSDAGRAVREVAERVKQDDSAFALVFCSVRYALPAVARGLAEAFPSVPVFGCTTSGELGGNGHESGGLAVASAGITERESRDAPAMRAAIAGAKDRIGVYPQRFALLFIDGLSGMEETVSQACQREFGDIPVVGGSAGDDERYEGTFVLRDGAFRRGEAVILAVTTTRTIKPFQTHPFFSSGTPLVITSADPKRRGIVEINGKPARDALGVVECVIGFECTLNKREFLDSPRKDDIERLYRDARVFGFTTYGEQFRGLHMSQTLTGVAFGPVVAPLAEYPGEWPCDDLRGEIDRLNKIIAALVSHDDSLNSPADSPYAAFHKTAFLETAVNARTAELSAAIAELESANKALANAKEKFQAIFDLLPTPTLVSRLSDGLIVDVNARFCEVFGFAKRAILGKRSDEEGVDLWPKESGRQQFLDQLEREGGVLQGFELKLKDSAGEKRPFIVSARTLKLDDDHLIIFEFQDSGDYAQKISILRDLSERDALTGLPNRLLILDRLQQATRLLRRNGQRMAVAYLDLDGFKEINDRYGHRAGDLVLTETARRLRFSIRESDTVGRMGATSSSCSSWSRKPTTRAKRRSGES